MQTVILSRRDFRPPTGEVNSFEEYLLAPLYIPEYLRATIDTVEFAPENLIARDAAGDTVISTTNLTANQRPSKLTIKPHRSTIRCEPS